MTKVNALKTADADETSRQEFELAIEGIIEVPVEASPKQFFDGLLDTILDYVERHKAVAGLSMSSKEYTAPDDEADNGGATTENR